MVWRLTANVLVKKHGWFRMELMLFGALLLVAVVLYALGKAFSAVAFVGIAGLVLILLGMQTLISGVAYYQVNATTVNYTFSSDYFEFANDSVSCSNCTSVVYNESSNTTPPYCCEHDVNTTINGLVSESRYLSYDEIEVDLDYARILGLILSMVGLVSVVDASMSFRREMKERGSMF